MTAPDLSVAAVVKSAVTSYLRRPVGGDTATCNLTRPMRGNKLTVTATALSLTLPPL